MFPSGIKEGDLRQPSIAADASHSKTQFLLDEEATEAQLNWLINSNTRESTNDI